MRSRKRQEINGNGRTNRSRKHIPHTHTHTTYTQEDGVCTPLQLFQKASKNHSFLENLEGLVAVSCRVQTWPSYQESDACADMEISCVG